MCVAALRLRGGGGGEEYHWHWLRGTNEVFMVSKCGAEHSASRENIFEFLSLVMVFHKVLIELDSISMKVYFMYAVKNYETLEASYLMFYNPQKGISNIPAIEI